MVRRIWWRLNFWWRTHKAEHPNPRLGNVLGKACWDEYSYAVKLTSGEMICFKSATYDGGDYILLKDITRGPEVDTGRGVAVNLSAIVWAVDAWDGS